MLRDLYDRWLRRRRALSSRASAPLALRRLRPPRAPLPAALAERLREIPHNEILCRDLDHQGLELLRGELPARRAAALRDHLEDCRRCSAVAAALAAAIDEPPRPLPGRLVFRLHSLARPRNPAAALPPFLRDGRHAAAVAAVVAVLLTTAAGGDPAAVASRAVDATSLRVRHGGARLEEPLRRARQWAEVQGRELRRSATAAWESQLARGRWYSRLAWGSLQHGGARLEAEARRLGDRIPKLLELITPQATEMPSPGPPPSSGEEARPENHPPSP